mmetsp:Transcript_33965/g.63390  ORF Transcript_33965/g.63390 Transcript_33965/m.63390 type:complete len:768 (+) Transcript_33965:1328-3631(+)
MNRLGDILDCERKMGGRTVQKYVETPLLTNQFHLRPSEPACKFDLRVWVLITSFQPLKAHIYSRVYGRRCGQAYSYVASSISDTYTHLTNYSIQSKKVPFSLKPPASDEGVDEEDEEGGLGNQGRQRAQKHKQSQRPSEDDLLPSGTAAKLNMFETILQEDRGLKAGGGAAGKLRSTIQSQRVRPSSAGATRRPSKSSLQPPTGPQPPSSNTASELLVTFDELLAELAAADVNHNGRALWEGRVWPAIQRKVSDLLLMSAQHVHHREKSFEFLGFDVLIDEQCEPWILEVNMSPALAHRDPIHNELIKSMAEQMVELLLNEYANMDVQTVTGVSRVGAWQELDVEGSGAENRNDTEISSDRPPAGPGKRRLSKSLALALALAEAQTVATNPNSAPNYEGSFGYVEPPSAPLKSTKEFVPSIDLAFTLQGSAVTAAEVRFADRCNNAFSAALLLQRWARQYLPRTRLFHERRLRAAWQLQQCMRAFLARSQLMTLRRDRASVHLQCAWRQRLARTRRALLLLTRAAEAVQRATRVRQACRRARRRRHLLVARRLLIWYRHRKRRWRRGSARRIQRCFRRWWRLRCEARRRIISAVKMWYLRRDTASRVIGRPWRRCIVHLRWYSAWRLRRLSVMAAAAAEVGLQWAVRKQQAREAAVRKEEETQQQARVLQEQAAREQSWQREQEAIRQQHQAWLTDLGLETEEQEASSQSQLEQHRDKPLAELTTEVEDEQPRNDAGSFSQGGDESLEPQKSWRPSSPNGNTMITSQ